MNLYRKNSFVLIFLVTIFNIFSCKAETTDYSPEEVNDTAQQEQGQTDSVNNLYNIVSFIEQPSSMSVSINQSYTLSCSAECSDTTIYYRWFECSDALGTTKIPLTENWTESSTIEINGFTEMGIRYFVCAATNAISDALAQDNSIPENTVYSELCAVAYTGLPIIVINTGDVATVDITKEEYVSCNFKLLASDGTLTVNKELTKKGIKGRGNQSWVYPKKGYNLNFDSKVSFFNLPASKKWCIVSNYDDPTLMHNTYASELGTKVFNSNWNPTFVYVDVIINNEYLGNYIFCEKNTIQEGRINIQDISDVEENLLNGKTSKIIDSNGDGKKDIQDGGFVLEVDFRADADFSFQTIKGVIFTLKEPDEVTKYSQERIKQIVQQAEDSLYSNSFSDVIDLNGRLLSKWMQYIDIDSLLDWYVINEFAKQLDAPFITSVYLYYNPVDCKLYFGPIWDFDKSFGTVHRDPFDLESPEGWFVRREDGHAGLMSENWISRMAQDDTFIEFLKNRWNEKKSELYLSINTDVDDIISEINLSAELNFIKWGTDNSQAYKETWGSSVSEFKSFCNQRYEWIDSEINNQQ